MAVLTAVVLDNLALQTPALALSKQVTLTFGPDNLAINEPAISPLVTKLRTILDNLALQEQAERIFQAKTLLFGPDNLALSDLFSISAGRTRTLADNLALLTPPETSTRSVTKLFGPDFLALQELLTPIRGRNLSVTDNLALQELADSLFRGITFNFGPDRLALSENVLSWFGLLIFVSDSLALADGGWLATKAQPILVSDNLAISDLTVAQLVLAGAKIIKVFDFLGLSERTSSRTLFLRQVVDNLAFMETAWQIFFDIRLGFKPPVTKGADVYDPRSVGTGSSLPISTGTGKFGG